MERANKEVNRHLRAIIYYKGVDSQWSLYLPMVERILNSATNSSIGVSPAQLVFGNSVQLDRGLLNPMGMQKTVKTLSEFSAKMLSAQSHYIEAAIATQKAKDELQHMKQDEITVYPINSYVLVAYRDAPPSKLHTNLRGPLRVVNIREDNEYTLQNLVTNEMEDVHITQLRPFYFDEESTDPRMEANKDDRVVEVETILNHQGDPRGSRKEIFFEVKWKNKAEKHNEWLPYSKLRHNTVLHDYLRSNNMKFLIPKY